MSALRIAHKCPLSIYAHRCRVAGGGEYSKVDWNRRRSIYYFLRSTSLLYKNPWNIKDLFAFYAIRIVNEHGNINLEVTINIVCFEFTHIERERERDGRYTIYNITVCTTFTVCTRVSFRKWWNVMVCLHFIAVKIVSCP